MAIAEGRADYLEEPKLVGQPTKEEMREWQKDARKAEGLPDVEEAVTRGIELSFWCSEILGAQKTNKFIYP